MHFFIDDIPKDDRTTDIWYPAVSRAVLLVAVALSCCISQAHAHAFLDHALPRVGSTVHGSPSEVRLWFTQDLEPAFSTLRVVDDSGKQVDEKDKGSDPRDASVLRVSVSKLSPGRYRVLWRVVSVDTHVTEGDFIFIVVP